MSNVLATRTHIPSMEPEAISKVRALEVIIASMPQTTLDTHHVIHAGQYARTIVIPAGHVLTGVVIKIPTILIVNGDCTVYVGTESTRVTGYNVLTASGNRKQAFIAHEDTYLTMMFATKAQTVEQAEDEFTDEGDQLLSRSDIGSNHIVITGE